MRCNIYRLLIGSEIQFGQLLFNCVSSGFSNATAYATWHVSNLRLLLFCAFIARVSSALMLGDPITMKMDLVEREGCICVMQFPAFWSRLSAVASSWLGAVASTRRLLVHNWINDLLQFTHVFNIVISLSSTSHYYRCQCVIVMCIYTMIT